MQFHWNPFSSVRGREIYDYFWEDENIAWFDADFTTSEGDLWYKIEFTNYAEHPVDHHLTKMPKNVIIVHVHQMVDAFAVRSDDTYETPLSERIKSLYTVIEIIYDYIQLTTTKAIIFPVLYDRQEKRRRLFSTVQHILSRLLEWDFQFSLPFVQVLAKTSNLRSKAVRFFINSIS